jgi:hypothetical protein
MYIIEPDVELRYSPIKSGKSQISNLSVYRTYAVALSKLLCLRQHGTSHFIVVRFFALRAKNEQRKEDKAPPCITTPGHRVSSVI